MTGVPRFVPSTMNWMVPPGVPDPGAAAETVAVYVAEPPSGTGFGLAVSVVRLASTPTVTVSAVELLPKSNASPP